MTPAGELTLTYDGAVAIITINTPGRRNAISYEMWRAFPEVLARVRAPARCLVITGAGDDFSAGADIAQFPRLRTATNANDYSQAVADAVGAIAGHDLPTVAAISGYCVGGGCEIAVACDIRIAGHSAHLGITPAKLGLVYSLTSTRRLAGLVGAGWSRYLLLTAAVLPAERALAIGLVHELHEDDAVRRAALALARRMSSLATVSQRASRSILDRLEAALPGEDASTAALYEHSYRSTEYREGVRAFLERRAPDFPTS